MSSKQSHNTDKTRPGHATHGLPSRQPAHKGSNSHQPRTVGDWSPHKQDKQTEGMQEPNESENAHRDPAVEERQHHGADTRTPEQNSQRNANAKEHQTGVSDTNSQSNEGAGRSSAKQHGDDKAIIGELKHEKADKETKGKQKHETKISNKSDHNEPEKHEKRTSDENKPSKTKSRDSGYTGTKPSKATRIRKNHQRETSSENSHQTDGKSNGKCTRSRNEHKFERTKAADLTTRQEQAKHEACSQDGEQEKKASLDEESLQMFLSTENLHEDGRRTGGGSWWMSPEECSDETKRKQEEIIRRILEEFNLEDTMDRYRNSNTVVIQRHGKSLADFRFRSEMIRMMGSEEIRLNDQDWSRRFNRRLLEDYEKHLDEKENNLAQAERQRVHRLRMEGILHDTEDSPPSTGMDVSISRLPHVSSKKKNRNGRHSVPSAAGIAEEPKRVFAYEQSDKRERTLLTNRQEKIYHPSKDVQTQVARLYTDGEEGNEEEEAEEEGSVNEPDKQKDRLGADVRFERKGHSYLSIGVDEDYEEKMVKRRRKRYQHLPPNVARLYEEETVAGLYQMAAELLSSASPAQEEDQRKEVKIV